MEAMKVSAADVQNRLPELIRAVEGGENVAIPRDGKPVAELTPAVQQRCQVCLGGMKGRIELLPGWDAPIDLDCFLSGGV
jgi:prevent-host-death family protein